jgi:ribose 5-phosphate isomerase B
MQTQMKLAIGGDLAAYDFKTAIIKELKNRGYIVIDVGCHSSMEGDYPDVAKAVAELVVTGEADKGILMCGTGQGVCMAANKCKGVRAALCYDVLPAILAREHNNANILATGAWIVSIEKALAIIEAFLFGKYAGGRHDVRINKMMSFEEEK